MSISTDEIIACLLTDLRKIALSEERRYSRHSSYESGFLDIGAGNGKVLDAARRWDPRKEEDRNRGHVGPFYAIEKSQTLLNLLDPSVFILGCDFWNTTLHDKKIGYIFSNPPYSRFVEWTEKILREAPSSAIIWLVIPERWMNNARLQAEIKFRKAETKVLGSFDFQSAEERTARAKVHLLRITLPTPEQLRLARRKRGQEEEEVEPEMDPFERFFEETFTFAEDDEEEFKSFNEKVEETKVVHRANFIEALCLLYQARMMELHRNYQAVCDISPAILKEFEISKGGLIASLRMKIATAKKEYWERLFDGMEEINSRLTSASRKAMCELMNSQTGIDFNRDNCYAVVLWVIKNANHYFDAQLISMYEEMIDLANVENYASNKRVFKWNRFAYEYRGEKPESTHFRLKVGHRIVLQHSGGLNKLEYSWSKPGLNDRAVTFLNDMIVVANNLGFETVDFEKVHGQTATDSSAFVIRCWTDGKKGRQGAQSLMRVRAFQNGNLHIQFIPDFIHALNTAHGRLKGWLRDDAEASAELDIPIETAARYFKPGFRLEGSSLRLMAPAA